MKAVYKKLLIKSLLYRVGVTLGEIFIAFILVRDINFVSMFAGVMIVINFFKFVGYFTYDLFWEGEIRFKSNIIGKICRKIGVENASKKK